MFRITAILCALLFATVAHAADDPYYLVAVKKAKSIAGPKINETIKMVQDEMTKFLPDMNSLREKLHEELIKFTADVYTDINAIGPKISDKVENATKKVEQSKLEECFTIVEKLHESAETAINKLDECAWIKLKEPDVVGGAKQSNLNKTIEELNAINEKLIICDSKVTDQATAWEAIKCINSAEGRAFGKANEFSLRLLIPSGDEIRTVIEGCSTTTNFPNLETEIKNASDKCDELVNK